MERSHQNISEVLKLEAEKKELAKALEVSNQKLKEEVERNTGFVAELDTTMAEICKLKAETEVQGKRAAELEAALEKQKAELEATMEKQKDEVEAKLQAEADSAFNDGVEVASKLYEAQVLTVSQRVWELGCRTALKEARIPEDHPVYQNLPKFPSSEPESCSAPCSYVAYPDAAPSVPLSFEVPPEATVTKVDTGEARVYT